MTPIDIRVKFKLCNGQHPLYNYHENYMHGKYKIIYGLWLEEQFNKNMREEYFREQGDHAIYYSNRRNRIVYLKQEYIQWLENKVIHE